MQRFSNAISDMETSHYQTIELTCYSSSSEVNDEATAQGGTSTAENTTRFRLPHLKSK